MSKNTPLEEVYYICDTEYISRPEHEALLEKLAFSFRNSTADLEAKLAVAKETLDWIDQELKDGTRTDFKPVIRERIALARIKGSDDAEEPKA